MDFIARIFASFCSWYKSIPWDEDFTYGGPAGGSTNIDGAPMHDGLTDIKGNPYGIINNQD